MSTKFSAIAVTVTLVAEGGVVGGDAASPVKVELTQPRDEHHAIHEHAPERETAALDQFVEPIEYVSSGSEYSVIRPFPAARAAWTVNRVGVLTFD